MACAVLKRGVASLMPLLGSCTSLTYLWWSPYRSAHEVRVGPIKEQCEPGQSKNSANLAKHGLSFDVAVEVFRSEHESLELFDEVYSDFEDRFITIGPVRSGLVLVVWTETVDEVTRLISARRATPGEKRMYHEHMESRR